MTQRKKKVTPRKARRARAKKTIETILLAYLSPQIYGDLEKGAFIVQFAGYSSRKQGALQVFGLPYPTEKKARASLVNLQRRGYEAAIKKEDVLINITA